MVIGGGGVAERKVREILIQQGKVRLVSPALSPKLQRMASGDKVVWLRKEYEPEDLNGAFLVYAATSSRAVQKRIQRDANAANQLINIADDPEGSAFMFQLLSTGEILPLLSQQTAKAQPCRPW